MAVNDDLFVFVRDALGKGITRAEVERALLAAGWSADQVKGALRGFADVEFPVPVPRPRPYQSAREAFMYLVMFVTLYIAAYSLGSLCFELVDHWMPDPASRVPPQRTLMAIRWSIAWLIVSTPVFAYVSWIIRRGIQRDPTKRASKIRRQLTYVTLFVASCTLIGDVTTLVFNLLGGDLTVRFVIKMLVVAAIAGTGFGYYLDDLRKDDEELEA